MEYIHGIRGNIKDLKAIYPEGYIVRIYHDKRWEENSELMNHLCTAYCEHRNMVDLCPVHELHSPASGQPLFPKNGMLWRFAPMADILVTEFHSRDLDSRPTKREWAAVDMWLRSNRTYHVMRDHIFHTKPIMGGMWGMRFTKNADRKETSKIFDEMLSRGLNGTYGVDQGLLADYLWPLAKHDMMAHDSYHCRHFQSTMNQSAMASEEGLGREELCGFAVSVTKYIEGVSNVVQTQRSSRVEVMLIDTLSFVL